MSAISEYANNKVIFTDILIDEFNNFLADCISVDFTEFPPQWSMQP